MDDETLSEWFRTAVQPEFIRSEMQRHLGNIDAAAQDGGAREYLVKFLRGQRICFRSELARAQQNAGAATD